MLHLSTIDPETFKLLQELFTLQEINEQFALAGGTSLALQVGHRKSIDLDFFSEQSFNTRDVELLLAAEYNDRFTFVNSTKRMLFCYINDIKCDFVAEPAKLIAPFTETEGIRLFSTADIAAMKMHTICGRGKKKDFVDVYVLTKIYGWQKLLSWFEQKYGTDQFYFLWRSISYFSDADEDADAELLPPFDETWENIKKYITEHCK